MASPLARDFFNGLLDKVIAVLKPESTISAREDYPFKAEVR